VVNYSTIGTEFGSQELQSMLYISCTFYYNLWNGYEDILFGNWVVQKPSYQTVKRIEWQFSGYL